MSLTRRTLTLFLGLSVFLAADRVRAVVLLGEFQKQGRGLTAADTIAQLQKSLTDCLREGPGTTTSILPKCHDAQKKLQDAQRNLQDAQRNLTVVASPGAASTKTPSFGAPALSPPVIPEAIPLTPLYRSEFDATPIHKL